MVWDDYVSRKLVRHYAIVVFEHSRQLWLLGLLKMRLALEFCGERPAKEGVVTTRVVHLHNSRNDV